MALEQTDSMGVPLGDHELNDPSSDPDAPDPLLGETAQSGALAKAVPTQASARKNASDRFDENQSEMADLRSQYASTAKQQADAYAQEKAQIDAATERLMGMQVGPSDQEKLYRIAAAGSTPNHNGVNISGINQTQADVLAERRNAEMQKQQLLAQYAMAGPQATIGATNAKLNQLTQQQRIVAGQINSAGGQQFRGQANLPAGLTQNADGSMTVAPGMEQYWNEKSLAGMYGKGYMLPNPDGSKRWVSLAPTAAALQSNQNRQPQAPQTPPVAPPVAPKPQVPQQPPQNVPQGTQPQTPPVAAQPPAAAPPQAPSKPLPSPYDDLFLPSTVLDPKYGALTPATKPAYVATASQAFDPAYFKEYQFQANNFGDMDVRKKNLETEGKELADAGVGAQQTIYNYGQALQNMDKLSDPQLLTGPAGLKIGAFENTLRGVLPDNVTQAIFSDPDMKKLATQQDTDKYFLNAATSGLKAIYGGRITNMEVQQRLKSLPSNNLLPAVTKMLASAQAEVAQDTVNKGKLFGAYVRKGGDPAPSTFNTWYEANFSPFHQSRLQDNLKAQQALAKVKTQPPAVAAQDPLVQYYVALSQWKAAGSKGTPPQKPQ
jgi:hypothetical protein